MSGGFTPPPGGFTPPPPGGYGPPPGGVPPGGASGFSPPPIGGAPPGGFGIGLPPGVNPAGVGGPGGAQQESMGTTSMALGIVSLPLCFCCSMLGIALGITAVVLGIISIQRINAEPQRYTGKAQATIGIVCGAAGPVLYVVLVVLVMGASMLPALGGKGWP